MNSEFDIVANLPLMIFAFFFLLVFIIFIAAGIILLTAKDDLVKREKGRKTLLTGFFSFLVLLAIVAVFYGVTYFLKRGEVFRPEMSTGEMPSSPAINFPPSKGVVKIGNYYFDGPWPWEEAPAPQEPALYAVICKEEGQDRILGIGEADGHDSFYSGEDTQCWSDNCRTMANGLYLAVFWIPQDYGAQAGRSIREGIIREINPPCSSLEEAGAAGEK